MMRARVAVAALSVVAVAACEDGTGPNLNAVPGYSISSVRVFPSEATIFVPDTIRASDRITFAGVAVGKSGAVLSGIQFVWSTSDPSIAVVDENGTVTPVRTGTVEISASAHKIGKATLVIVPATQTVTVSPALDSIFVDEPIVASRDFQQLSAQAADAFGQPLTGVTFSWQSAANSVASVDFAGMVRASGLGTASITVSANGASAVSSIRVVPVVAAAQLNPAPAQVLALDTVQLVAVARDYSNAAMTRVFNWTSSNPSVATVDSKGQVKFLATGSATITARTAFRTTSTSITALERALTAIDAGGEFTCGFTNLGRGYCWGLADDGRTGVEPDSSCFGPDNRTCILPPKRMNSPELSFTAISAGGDFGCGIATDQMLYCWGNDAVGQVGNGLKGAGVTPSLATVKNERFKALSAGEHHACALNLAGRAFCWGSDSDGQLGDVRLMNSTTPIPVSDSTIQFTAISAGDRHTCGISVAGNAWCWGRGAEGQLGNGGTSQQETPTLVGGGHSFVAISAGGAHTCAVEASGSMYCWGANAAGQVGNGALGTPQLVPALVSGGGGYTAVAAGFNHSCGISGGQIRCWGGSESGEVGNGITTSNTVAAPVTVAGLQAVSISAGFDHTCAISTEGKTWCWGSNRWGALGNEFQAAIRATPQLVATPR